MSAGFRAGSSSDGYIQIDGVDKIKIDGGGVLYADTIAPRTTTAISLSSVAAHAIFSINKPTGAYTAAVFGSRSGLSRWAIDLGNSTTESGSNVGSDFQISRYADAGSVIATSILIERSTGNINLYGHIIPNATNTLDMGTASLRWRNIYTMDLQLSNGIGDYTIVEGADDLFLYNNKSGKTYKFLIQEVDSSVVPPKAAHD